MKSFLKTEERAFPSLNDEKLTLRELSVAAQLELAESRDEDSETTEAQFSRYYAIVAAGVVEFEGATVDDIQNNMSMGQVMEVARAIMEISRPNLPEDSPETGSGDSSSTSQAT